MRISIAAAVAVLAAAGAVHAESTTGTTAGAAQPAQGIVSYPAASFAEARPANAMDMIDRLPGFTFDGGASVRGFSGAAGNVLIDGERPTSKNDDLQSILRRVPASQIERIDVIRGGAPGIDMQGRTVMANVVRKKGSGVTGVAAVSNNSFDDGRQSTAVRLESTRSWDGKSVEGSLLAATYIDDGAGDGPRIRRDPTGTPLVISNVDARAGGFQATVTAAYSTPFAGGKLKINGMGFGDRYIDNEIDRLSLPGGQEDLHDRQMRKRGELGVHYSRNLGDSTTLEVLGIEQLRDNKFSERFVTASEEDFFTEKDTLSETIARATLNHRFNSKLSFEGALEGAYNVQDSSSAYFVDSVDQDLPAANVTISEKRGEASGSATWRPSDKFTVEGGLRVEVSTIASKGDVVQSKTLTYPKPRLMVTWSPNPDDQVRVRFEREVGQLNFGDFVASSAASTSGTVHAGNVDLVPQQAWVYEAAYERHFLKTGAAVITFRHQEIQDLADRAPLCGDPAMKWNDPLCTDVFDAPGNIGTGKENDIILALTIPLEKVGIKNGLLKTSTTWRQSEVADPTTGEVRRISGQHAIDGDYNFSQDLPKLKSTWGVNVFQGWRERYYRYNEIDTYKLGTWVQLFYEWKPDAHWSLRTEVNNAGSRPFIRDIVPFAGPRGPGVPEQYDDHRRQHMGPMLYFRLKRTFG